MYGYRIYYNDRDRRYEIANDESSLDEDGAYECGKDWLKKDLEMEGYEENEIEDEMKKYDIETYHVR